ncbi:uncharacterized protein LOC119607091 isoform X4 [Lucilia sericata]|uniref:uncharacterized protein LOC119607091 isoform X4 n=1 Tax=Lucilia sericata TaxID=13632 RepID=UPI0018A8757F|nr:uncharacterized protein LOC119607091 isoform X4 [Lucilia sericata]
MAAPFNLEDLAKLKSFVEFVAANPAILNLPQLDFLKKLIEQLGGKVPEGTFQMPAGAKCPFGGDVKSENKPTTASAEAEVDEEEIPEMEAESEESEVELDMEANNLTVLEPNILYLDEKPPKIVKTKRKPTNKKPTRKTISKIKQKFPTKKRTSKVKQDYIIKKELCIFEDQDKKMENDPNDPLYTAKLEIKCELDEENQNDSIECDFGADEQEDSDNDGDQDYNYKPEKSDSYDCEEYNENEDDEDEPLIVLSRRRGRSRKIIQEFDDEKVKIPRSVVCREICKQHCTEKFTEEQRKDICDYYWHLNKEDRVVFIRKHIRARRLTRTKRVKVNKIRTNNCYYYLKTYKIGSDETTPEDCKELIRVCRKFFEATLCTTNHFIKKANDGTVLEIEKELMLLSQRKPKDKEKEKCQEPQQILDPETGNLITVEPNSNKSTNLTEQNVPKDKQEKKKRIRRKPGDPLPEHFPKPINCDVRCIHKCHTKFTEEKRKQICDLFWSMDYKRRKDFVLANIEIKDVETQTAPDFRTSNRPPRTQQRRFFLRTGGMRGENIRVCRHFFTKTLCITGSFIDNAVEFADKTTGCYTGSDRRGGYTPNKKTEARKQFLLDHIDSYPYWIPNKKTKTKYLHHSLSIKKMYDDYKEKCLAEKIKFLSSFNYYTAFHDNFNLLFLANPHPKKGCALQKGNPNISHYTGEEPGGCWIDSKGNKLDLRSINPAQSLKSQHSLDDNIPPNSSVVANPFASGSNASLHTLNVVNPTSLMPLNTTANQSQSLAVVRSDLNPALYGNILHDPINMFKIL